MAIANKGLAGRGKPFPITIDTISRVLDINGLDYLDTSSLSKPKELVQLVKTLVDPTVKLYGNDAMYTKKLPYDLSKGDIVKLQQYSHN